MSDALEKAAREAVDVQHNSEQLRLVAAVLQAQQLLNAQQSPAPAPVAQRPVGLWVAAGLGGAVAVSAMALAAAVLAVAVAVGAVSATVCVVVLRGLVQDAQKNRTRN